MGWHINLITNDVKITEKCARAVLKVLLLEGSFNTLDQVWRYKKLRFHQDHMEWMDYLKYAKVITVLQKHKVKGDICFSSNDGDNAGEAWGYRFNGKGGFKPLTGRLQWFEKDDDE